ncbi:2-dehydropantoate 2-reductase [Desulfurispirillum indicum S5]|uniref:2-dehydropantoate 2-reductase n=1 Tax=Desulfurispirillum indicum (strain ATCC BAA-1389 / DSM 22839 / S5) TaxID=653733 RepID=E6W0G4_DESIS|nr:2-dehydropantoate 2-reductase [Desulfurispirillum indicum]ADU66382.1 2-dehydropantoate 2-reductase [Desulfurispirillum indicum S5]
MTDLHRAVPHMLIVGAGAIGSYYGSKLHRAGARVSFLCRSGGDMLRETGITIDSLHEERFHFHPQRVLMAGEPCPEPVDYIVLTTKVLPGISGVDIIRPYLGEQTVIVLIQNGIDIEVPYRQAYPEHEIISVLAFVCVSRLSPGKILHQDYGKLALGNYPEGKTPYLEALVELLRLGGVTCEVTDRVQEARWRKLVWNASFNTLSVLGGGVDTAQLLADEESCQLVRQVMEEVCLVAAAEGHRLVPSIVDEQIEHTRVMTPYKTSMLLDYENRRPMEVEVIAGNPMRKARLHGLSVPRLEMIYRLLRLQDAQRRRQRG